MEKKSKLSRESLAWLTACLDPYHDYQQDIRGLPDMRSSPSVVQMHNQSYTLTAPASAAGGLWDAKISYTGFDVFAGQMTHLVDENSWAANIRHYYDHAALNTTGPLFGALSIRAGATGVPISMGILNVGDTATALPSFLTGTRGRLIAVAYEVHNTTADIYKQGSVTTAMLAGNNQDASTLAYRDTNVAPYDDISFQADRSTVFACTRSDLQTIPTSQTWEAAKGVYAIPRCTSVPEKLSCPNGSTRVPVVYSTDGHLATVDPFAIMAIDELPVVGQYDVAQFSPMESFFTGLSPQTTLSITFRTVIEYFPAPGDVLLPMSMPSPAYDPRAFAIYSAAAKLAPYAVQINMNAAGDYFRMVLRAIAASLPTLAPLLGPAAPLASVGGPLLAQALTAWEKAQKPRKIRRDVAGAGAMPQKPRN